jgi:hypothetical protein
LFSFNFAQLPGLRENVQEIFVTGVLFHSTAPILDSSPSFSDKGAPKLRDDFF